MNKIRLLITFFCLLSLAGWLAACSSDDDPATPPGDTDDTQPQVLATFPEDGGGDADLDDPLQVVFSEAMDADSADGAVTLAGGTITGTSWETDRVLNIAHTTFAEGATVTLTLGTGLTDEAGNALAAAHVVEFLTESSNLILMDVSPADGATVVPVNTGITLRFSESVSTSQLESWVILTDILVTKAGGPDKVNFGFQAESMGDNTYLLVPGDDLPASTLIYVYVSDLLQSYQGHSPVDPYLSSFTTGTGQDTTPPTVLAVEPANGSTNVPRDQGYIRFTFSESINEDELRFGPYNLTFLILVEYTQEGVWDWNADFTQLTIGLPSDLPPGAPIDVTISGLEDVNGVVQSQPFHYTAKVTGNADYLPFVDGARYIDDRDYVGGPLEGSPDEDGDDTQWVEIDMYATNTFREVQYEDPGMGEDPFMTPTGAWDAFRETGSAFEWLGWEDEPEVVGKSNDFDPPLTVLPLPFGPGTWTDQATVVVADDGTYTGTIEGRVLPRQDYVIGESGGEAFIKDAWIVVFDLDAELGGELAVTMHDTIVYAPTLGPVRTVDYNENYDENRWYVETTWRWPYVERTMGPVKTGRPGRWLLRRD